MDIDLFVYLGVVALLGVIAGIVHWRLGEANRKEREQAAGRGRGPGA